jgi:hypothetical protein
MTLQMNREDILQSAKTMTQGLETLRIEHDSLLQTLLDRLELIKSDLNFVGLREDE